MSDSDTSTSIWSHVWRAVVRYWHWPVLVAVAVYAYQQYLPSIDLSEHGRPAPTVVAETMDGDRFRLQDYRGDVVVVNVWATWCPPCRVEMPGFVDLQQEFRGEGVHFVGIALDQEGEEAVRPFVEEKGINFPQILDPALAARQFPGEVVPRTYLIDKRGRIRYEHSGVILKWALDDALETLVDEPATTATSRRPTPEAAASTRPRRRGKRAGQG